jgi:NTP pyrophosphatase (non-canonical NTP hydrolase)
MILRVPDLSPVASTWVTTSVARLPAPERSQSPMVTETTMARLLAFRAARDWQQFHTPKNLAISISLEANELLEHFQWLADGYAVKENPQQLQEISYEIADVAIYLNFLAHDLGIDLEQAILQKLDISEQKYPVAKARGKALKYDRL